MSPNPPLPLGWLLAILTITLISYGLLRSVWIRASFIFQIIVATLVPIATSYFRPDASAPHFAMIIPVILTSFYFGRRAVVAMICISIFALLTLYPNYDPNQQHILLQSLFIDGVIFAVILMTRTFHEWLEDHHHSSIEQQFNRLNQLISATFEGTARLSGNRVTEVSEGFAQAIGEPRELLEGKDILEILPAFDDTDQTMSTHAIYHANKQMRFVEVVRSTVEQNLELVAVRDVTLQTQERVKRLQMDRVAAAGTLASGIAHELNTPLMVAMNQARIIDDGLETVDVAETRRRLKIIDDVLQQMVSILADLKWFVQSSVDDNQTEISQVIKNTIRLANHKIRHHLEISLDINTDRKPALSNHQLIQILTNFLINAADAKKPNDPTNRVRISVCTLGNEFVIAVQDNGIGMEQSVANRVVEPFFTHGKKSGTGLGLAICNHIIEKARGSLTIETAPNEGCKLTVTLPLANDKEDTYERSNGHRKIENILVVDDDPVLPSLIGEQLNDFTCTYAQDINRALELIDLDEVDAIVCDVNMPCGGAQHLFAQLEKMKHPLSKRMIVITGGAVSLGMQTFIDQTKQPVLFKPFRAGQLIDIIDTFDQEFIESSTDI